jgi:hypothetical protein
VAEVALRPIDDSDLDVLFEQIRDPESVRMAAFTAENPDDRTAFDVHMAKVRTLPGATTRAVTVDGRLAGSIASFVVDRAWSKITRQSIAAWARSFCRNVRVMRRLRQAHCRKRMVGGLMAGGGGAA